MAGIKLGAPGILNELRGLGIAVTLTEPHLNCGGCGVYAYYVARRLEALGYRVHGIAMSGYGDIDAAREDLEARSVFNPTMTQWNELGIWIRHLGVDATIDGRRYLIDSDMVAEWEGEAYDFDTLLAGAPTLGGRFTLDEMLTMVATPEGWNSKFNRNVVPVIKQVVDATLNTRADEALLEAA